MVLERALVYRTQIFGVGSAEVSTACKTLAELCNLQAISDLARSTISSFHLFHLRIQQLIIIDMNMSLPDSFRSAAELLKKATILTEQHPLVRAVTYNNYACFYRR